MNQSAYQVGCIATEKQRFSSVILKRRILIYFIHDGIYSRDKSYKIIFRPYLVVISSNTDTVSFKLF